MRFTVLSVVSVLPLLGCGAGEGAEVSKAEPSATLVASVPAEKAPPAPAPAPTPAAAKADVAEGKVDPAGDDDLAAHQKMVEAGKKAAEDAAAAKRELLEGQRANPVPAPAPTGMPRATPRLYLPEKEKDFGAMLDGEVAEHAFPFENAGDAPLTISRVQPSCGCTVSEVKIGDVRYEYNRSMPPGTRGTIGVRLDSRGQHGTLSKTVQIFSDDPSGPLTLRIQAQVEQFFVLEPQPPTLNLGTVFVGETKSATLKVRTERVEAFEITETSPLPKGLTVTWAPLEGKKNAYEVTATLGEGLNEGTFTNRVTLKTNVERTIDFYVTASISGPIQVLPTPYVLFGLIARGAKTSRSIEVAAREGEPPLAITEATLDVQERGGTAPKDLGQYFEVNVRPIEEGRRYTIEVTAKEDLPPGVFGGTLRIKTNHPSVPQKDVVISGFVR